MYLDKSDESSLFYVGVSHPCPTLWRYACKYPFSLSLCLSVSLSLSLSLCVSAVADSARQPASAPRRPLRSRRSFSHVSLCRVLWEGCCVFLYLVR